MWLIIWKGTLGEYACPKILGTQVKQFYHFLWRSLKLAYLYLSTRRGLIGGLHPQDPLQLGVVLVKEMYQKSGACHLQPKVSCVSLAAKAFQRQCAWFVLLLIPQMHRSRWVGRTSGSLVHWIEARPCWPIWLCEAEINSFFFLCQDCQTLRFAVYWYCNMASFIISNELFYSSLACNNLLVPIYCLYWWVWKKMLSFSVLSWEEHLIELRIKSSVFKFTLWCFWRGISVYNSK